MENESSIFLNFFYVGPPKEDFFSEYLLSPKCNELLNEKVDNLDHQATTAGWEGQVFWLEIYSIVRKRYKEN